MTSAAPLRTNTPAAGPHVASPTVSAPPTPGDDVRRNLQPGAAVQSSFEVKVIGTHDNPVLQIGRSQIPVESKAKVMNVPGFGDLVYEKREYPTLRGPAFEVIFSTMDGRLHGSAIPGESVNIGTTPKKDAFAMLVTPQQGGLEVQIGGAQVLIPRINQNVNIPVYGEGGDRTLMVKRRKDMFTGDKELLEVTDASDPSKMWRVEVPKKPNPYAVELLAQPVKKVEDLNLIKNPQINPAEAYRDLTPEQRQEVGERLQERLSRNRGNEAERLITDAIEGAKQGQASSTRLYNYIKALYGEQAAQNVFECAKTKDVSKLSPELVGFGKLLCKEA